MSQLEKMPPLIPELQVRNIAESVHFYVDVLGFSIVFDRPESKFAMIALQGSWIMLEQTDRFTAVSDDEFIKDREWRTGALEYPFGRGINFQIIIDDIDAKYTHVQSMNYPIKVPLEEQWYRAEDKFLGVKQFLLLDPDGYLLRIQQDNGIKPLADASHY